MADAARGVRQLVLHHGRATAKEMVEPEVIPLVRIASEVLGDDKGHLVDIHSYTFDENGKNIFGVAYEPRHLTGAGMIDGYLVKCPPPDVMVEFHTGYDVDENDYHDAKALCERYNIPLPKDYEKFESK